MVEQKYDAKYVYFILGPALVSLFTSSLLVINFIFISKKLQGYMYHKLSSVLALFDIIQQIGTILSAPFFFSADKEKCAYREYLFLFGSFCKALTVMYISGTISYVIHFSKVPSKEAKKRSVIGFVLFTAICFVLMPIYNASATLCSDPTAGNFHHKSVDRHSSTSFSALYVCPLVFCFFLNLILILNTASRLKSMFNSALMKLLVRLLPGPVIFSLALLPSSIFQLVVYISGHENYILKVLALLGMNLSGALYAGFYFYELVRDDVLFSSKVDASKNDGAALREEGGIENSVSPGLDRRTTENTFNYASEEGDAEGVVMSGGLERCRESEIGTEGRDSEFVRGMGLESHGSSFMNPMVMDDFYE